MSRNYRSKRKYRPRPSSKTRFWYIGKRNKNNELIGLLVVTILIGGGAWGSLSQSSQALLIVLLAFVVILLFGVVVGFMWFMSRMRRQKLRALSSAQVDTMDGHRFEHYVAALMEKQGFTHVQVTQASGDYGVDVTAFKDGQKWAVQAKRFRGTVPQDAIREAVAGCAHYQCQRSMVVTTGYFTPHAKTLARSNGTVLVDRDQLASWILSFQS